MQIGLKDLEFLNTNMDLLDVSIDNLKIVKKYVKSNKICRKKYNLPFSDSAYDTLMCLEVLEHLGEPEKALKEIKRVFRSYAIILVSNTLIFRICDLFSLKKFKQFWRGFAILKYKLNKEKFEKCCKRKSEFVASTIKHFWLIRRDFLISSGYICLPGDCRDEATSILCMLCGAVCGVRRSQVRHHSRPERCQESW